MQQFSGKGVYGAIAIGNAHILKKPRAHINKVQISDARAELARFERAKNDALEQLSDIYERALGEVGKTNAQIFEIHMMMLEDEDYDLQF